MLVCRVGILLLYLVVFADGGTMNSTVCTGDE